MKAALMVRSALAGLLVCGGAAAAAEMATLVAVSAIEPGQWQLREVGTSAAPRSMCVTDPATLLQIEHGQAHCTYLVLSDQARTGTISYSCPGAGNGRTTLKLESASDFRLETQGINGGAPFDKAYQAHRMGACAATAR